jgi:PhzF family phenazine biosynthesis protein
MNLPLYQVDAFTDRLFGGNPAAVCPLEDWLPDETMQKIAAENNLAETAFFVRKADSYELRWFTPELEVDLCGHATLASAYTILRFLEPECKRVAFSTRSGMLYVEREGDRLAMDFPSRPPKPVGTPAGLVEALGATPTACLASRDVLALFDTEEEVRALAPDFGVLDGVDCFAVIASAPGNDCDFVSRFFAPRAGVAEDPVTGSAHCTLVPYWAARLGKTEMFARQVSRRGGELWLELLGYRVKIAGNAVLYMRGTISI